MNAPGTPDRAQLALEAAELIEKLSGKDGDRFTAEVERWCRRSPAHRQEFVLATLTNSQLEALETGPYSSRLPGYRAPLHSWISGNLSDPRKLKEISGEVLTRFRQLPRESKDFDPLPALYAIADELAQQQEQLPWQSGRRPPVPVVQKAAEASLSALSADHRDVLYSCARDGLTLEQTARTLGMSVNQVTKRFHNARQFIAARLLGR